MEKLAEIMPISFSDIITRYVSEHSVWLFLVNRLNRATSCANSRSTVVIRTYKSKLVEIIPILKPDVIIAIHVLWIHRAAVFHLTHGFSD